MAKTKRGFILATCFLSGAAAILSFVALGTQQWVSANAYYVVDHQTLGDNVYIGLFTGVFQQYLGAPRSSDLSIICVADLNICGMLCGDYDVNADNLRKMYNKKDITNKGTCMDSTTKLSSRGMVKAAKNNRDNYRFINAGVYVCTVLFLFISCFFGVFSCVLAIWNTASNPYQVYFSIFAMYIYNGIAAVSALLTMILWGSMFGADLIHNIPTYETYNEFTTENGDNKGQLGFSYWIILPSIILYICCNGLLYLRQYLMAKEPEVNVHIENNEDPGIYLY